MRIITQTQNWSAREARKSERINVERYKAAWDKVGLVPFDYFTQELDIELNCALLRLSHYSQVIKKPIKSCINFYAFFDDQINKWL